MIHGEEDRGLAFSDGKSCGQIAAPHLLDSAGGDGAVMNCGDRAASPALRRQELVFPPQPQHPPFGGSEAGLAQPGQTWPTLPIRGEALQHHTRQTRTGE